MSIYSICGLALCAVMICLLPGIRHSEYATAIRILFGVMIFGLSFSLLMPYLDLIRRFTESSNMEAYFPLLLRAVGIALLSEVTATVCRDAGEESIAKSVELLAKAEILILSFPLIKQLFDTAELLVSTL